MRCAPIVLFVYNRPEHTARTLSSLARNSLAAESDLIIYADGPKKPEHEASVLATRRIARQATGFRSLRIVERERNLGLAASITTGIAEICALSGRVIVVEDDLIVAPSFLQFLNAGLQRYEDDPRVMQISGYAYPAHDDRVPPAFFLPMVSCWGWATWASAWSRFDPDMQLLSRLDRDRGLRHRFDLEGAYDYYGMACQQRTGQIDSWGVRWQLSLFAASGLVLYPRTTLVTNIGVDASGTHGAGHAELQRDLVLSTTSEKGEFWPSAVETDRIAFDQVRQLLLSMRPGLFRRIIDRVRP